MFGGRHPIRGGKTRVTLSIDRGHLQRADVPQAGRLVSTAIVTAVAQLSVVSFSQTSPMDHGDLSGGEKAIERLGPEVRLGLKLIPVWGKALADYFDDVVERRTMRIQKLAEVVEEAAGCPFRRLPARLRGR